MGGGKAWQDWPQAKRDIAVRLLTPSDWSGFTNNMPSGLMQPGDTIDAPKIIFPGLPLDDPTTPEDERLPKVIPGPWTIPAPYPNLVPTPSPSPSSSPSPSPSPTPSPSPSPAPSPSPSPSPTPPPINNTNPPPDAPPPNNSSTPPDSSSPSPQPDSPSNPPPTTNGNTTEPSLSPDPHRLPGGTLTPILPKSDPENIRGVMRENDTATLLAQAGYNIEQNPPVPVGHGLPQPDYNIEGKLFDAYAPNTDSSKNIRNELNRKAKKQADRLVLNLDDSPVIIADIQAAIQKKPIPDLKELIVVKNRTVSRIISSSYKGL